MSWQLWPTSWAPTSHLVCVKIIQITWYFSSTCGKYPWYKFVYCTNNPELMLKISLCISRHMFSHWALTCKWPVGAQGVGHNCQLIAFTDYNLLFKGEDQVEICFIAYHEWIAKPIVVYNSYTIVNSGLVRYTTPGFVRRGVCLTRPLKTVI